MIVVMGKDDHVQTAKDNCEGVERWMSFKSTQDLVKRAIEIYLNEQQRTQCCSVPIWNSGLSGMYKKPMLEKNTANNYRCMLKNHILPVIGQSCLQI